MGLSSFKSNNHKKKEKELIDNRKNKLKDQKISDFDDKKNMNAEKVENKKKVKKKNRTKNFKFN